MKRIVTAIDAIMVEGSAVGLERQLSRRSGIENVKVNPRAQTVSVDFDETRLKPSDVGRYIAECGYHGLHEVSASPVTAATSVHAARPAQRT